ncbi:MAG: transporter substrate-binding domain-containing protein, partial [Oscillospiraceae bacterium]
IFICAVTTGCSGKKQITVGSESDLDNLSIGVQGGTTGETYVKESHPTAKVNAFKSGMDAALDLKNGGIDAIVLDELPAKSIVAQNSDLTIVDLDLASEKYAIAIKKGNTELTEKINTAIEAMQSDGSYKLFTDAFMPSSGAITPPAVIETSGDVIKMGTNAAFAPFEYLDGTEIVGFDISASQYIAKNMGKKLEVVNMDFDALIPALSSGQIDFIAAGMSVNPERLENCDFSMNYYESKQVVILRK